MEWTLVETFNCLKSLVTGSGVIAGHNLTLFNLHVAQIYGMYSTHSHAELTVDHSHEISTFQHNLQCRPYYISLHSHRLCDEMSHID